MIDSAQHGGRVSAAWVAGAVFLVLLATLPPLPPGPNTSGPAFRPFLPSNIRWRDVGQNVALFAPLGLVLAARGTSLGRALGASACLSAGIELLQSWIPGRDPSAVDVLANTLGGAAGYLVGRSSTLAATTRTLRWCERWLVESRSPDRRMGSLLLLAWACAVSAVFMVTGVLMRPAPLPVGGIAIASPLLDKRPGPLRIGSHGPRSGSFKGAIDEVRIYAAALNAEQIRIDMDHGAATASDDRHLLAAYGFDSADGNVARDDSGRGHDGRVSGASWTEHGRFGGALTFSGRSGEVVVPQSPLLKMKDALTLEAWVRASEGLPVEPAVISHAGGNVYLDASSSLGPLKPAGGGRFGAVPRNAQARQAIHPDEWTHLATTYDGRSIRLYVNGTLASTTVHWSPHRPARAAWNGVELSPGVVEDPDAFRASLFESVTLDVVLTCGPLDETPAPAFLAAGIQNTQTLALIARSDDLFVKPFTRAGRVGLPSPAARVDGALRGCSAGDALPLRLTGYLQNPHVSRGGEVLQVHAPGIASGWAFLIHAYLIPVWAETMATFLWLAMLSTPLGLWTRLTAISAAALVLAAAAVIVLPGFFHVRALNQVELAAVSTGIAIGVAVRRTVRQPQQAL